MTEEREGYWDELPEEDFESLFEEIADDFMNWKYEQWRNQYEQIA